MPRMPGWVRPMSALIIGLQRLGISFFSFHVLTVRGRRSGLMRSTVVSPFVVDGRPYVLSFGQLEWVRNARAAGSGLLWRGRRQQKVVLTEVKPPDGTAIVGEFPRQIPGGVQIFVRLGLVEAPGGPDQFRAAAEHLVLFRLDPA